jgi:hypothetical protein
MIKTTIIGLGKVGYLYDDNKIYKKISHFSSIKNNKNFRIVSVVEINKKIVNSFRKKNLHPIYDNAIEALNNHPTDLLVIACELKFRIIRKIIESANIKYILAEKPFKITKKNFDILLKLLKKKKIFFSVNFQRNFSDNYINLFKKIKKGLIGPNLKCYCYFNKNFHTNASHLLNLILLLNKKFISLRKFNNNCVNIRFRKLDTYFFNVSKIYNYNSITIFGSKGKIEISSRPEFAKLYLPINDVDYNEIKILKLNKKLKLYDKFPQDNVLKNITQTIKFKRKPSLNIEHLTKYFKIMYNIKDYL